MSRHDNDYILGCFGCERRRDEEKKMQHNSDTVPIRQILEAILLDAEKALERAPERGSLRDILGHICFNAEAALRQFDGSPDA